MKKIMLIITMLIFNINIFSFSLDSLEFNETLKKGEYKIREYILSNNTNEIKKYSISINSSNVEIKPKNFVLSPQKKQKIYIKVLGKGNRGINEFYLTITEKNLNKDSSKKNSIFLNKIIQIKQKYFLKEE
ncbi:MAG: hypothetical protein ACRDBY_14755 [Cetobacterium sp.]